MAKDTARKDLACFYEDKQGKIHQSCVILKIDNKKKKSQRYKIKYTIYSGTEEEGNYKMSHSTVHVGLVRLLHIDCLTPKKNMICKKNSTSNSKKKRGARLGARTMTKRLQMKTLAMLLADQTSLNKSGYNDVLGFAYKQGSVYM